MSQKRFSEEERLAILKKFANRQISIDKFCKTHNVSRPAIYHWKNLYKLNLPFVPLRIEPKIIDDDKKEQSVEKETSQSISSPLKLYKSGVIVEFDSGCSSRELQLIMEVLNATK